LVVAARGDRELFAQFTKGPIVVATARADGTGWELDFAMAERRVARRGKPNARFALFQLARVVNQAGLDPAWSFTGDEGGSWRLANPQTGEWLEGVWLP
jgi:hypothetical protein